MAHIKHGFSCQKYAPCSWAPCSCTVDVDRAWSALRSSAMQLDNQLRALSRKVQGVPIIVRERGGIT